MKYFLSILAIIVMTFVPMQARAIECDDIIVVPHGDPNCKLRVKDFLLIGFTSGLVTGIVIWLHEQDYHVEDTPFLNVQPTLTYDPDTKEHRAGFSLTGRF